ncbi:MAG: ATP-dependent DNA helicase [Euryarchaeota archaeon]|nr:ATP-dependent DNA helicase [Euryarchaeota archaeon]
MLPENYFPYPGYRRFQDELIDVIYRSEQLLCSAPAGAGKSVSALCGFLADRSEKEKIVVLTRTKSQGRIFLREMAAISQHVNEPFLTIQLRAKQELCPVFRDEETSYEEFVQLCKLKEDCPYREKFNENIDAMEELAETIAVENYVEYPDLIKKVSGYGCPHLVLKELLRFCDVVVASYLYLLNPFLRSMFLSKLDASMDELLIILDEAHNLQNLELMGRQLSLNTVNFASEELSCDFSNVYSIFEGENSELDVLDFIDYDEILFLHRSGVEILKERLSKGKKLSYTFRVASFLSGAAQARQEENWIFFRQGSKLHLKPLFPSEAIEPLKEAKKLLLMSGTLEPLEGYKILYGLENAETFCIPNIFPRQNCAYFGIKRGLNTGLKSREKFGSELWKRYAATIKKIHRASPKTGLVFFPSYEIMREVSKYIDALCESSDGRKTDEFWARLRNKNKKIVFAVSGGKLSEGVEYTVEKDCGKESVIGSVIVAGFPFPVPDFEMEIKSRYYEQKFGCGRAFFLLSILPMLNKVLQSTGRAIRSECDKAAIIFLDDRIEYFRYFPEEIRHELQVCSAKDIAEEVRQFRT